ncbi:hypothetical protein KQ945_16465 [Bacillus subtilis subsp. subtilis]|nr:hypothetical protein [Bacillus subtilis subsp. subtilis]
MGIAPEVVARIMPARPPARKGSVTGTLEPGRHRIDNAGVQIARPLPAQGTDVRHFSILLLIAALGGCATFTAAPPHAAIDAADAVRAANIEPARPVSGTFVMTVQAIGEDNGRVFLNSERDYRNQNCLTVVLAPGVAEQVAAQLGVDVPGLMQRRLSVRGQARRVRIQFHDGQDRASSKYYYQTHLQVDAPGQIALAAP